MRQMSLRLPDDLGDNVLLHMNADGRKQGDFLVYLLDLGMRCHIEDLREEAREDQA